MGKENQVKAIAIVAIIYGSLIALFGFALLLLGLFAVSFESSNSLISFFLVLLVLLFFTFFLLPLIGGIGLLKNKNWARILLIIVAALNLPVFPIGTGLGIWFLIVLLDEDVKKSFNSNKKINSQKKLNV
ncbi:MAG: hypothetical protein ABH811_01660 [archaeon]